MRRGRTRRECRSRDVDRDATEAKPADPEREQDHLKGENRQALTTVLPTQREQAAQQTRASLRGVRLSGEARRVQPSMPGARRRFPPFSTLLPSERRPMKPSRVAARTQLSAKVQEYLRNGEPSFMLPISSDALRSLPVLVWLLARVERGVRAEPSLLKADSRKHKTPGRRGARGFFAFVS